MNQILFHFLNAEYIFLCNEVHIYIHNICTRKQLGLSQPDPTHTRNARNEQKIFNHHTLIMTYIHFVVPLVSSRRLICFLFSLLLTGLTTI